MNTKIIEDLVHKYIELKDIEIDLINLPIFQRLHRIKQGLNTGAFPSSHHTRFEHSLGVMHLSSAIVNKIIEKETDASIKSELESNTNLLRVASLLHDVGHAPFSHIGEKFFDKSSIIQELCLLRGADFTSHYRNSASHELMSALFVLKHREINQILRTRFDSDKINFITDIITGNFTPYQNTPKHAIVQILYSMIDADKFDYVLRDNFMSGGTFVSIDIPRMINAYIFHNNTLLLDHKSLSTINSFFMGRSNIYMWVINHHRNVLSNGLCFEYIDQLIQNRLINRNNFFSYDAIESNLIDDIDIMTNFKNFKSTNPTTQICYNHLFSRGTLTPVWKSGIECEQILNSNAQQSDVMLNMIDLVDDVSGPRLKELEDKLKQYLTERRIDVGHNLFIFFCKDRHYKIPGPTVAARENVYILMRDGSIKRYRDIFPRAPVLTQEKYFYVYYDRNTPTHKQPILNYFSTN